MSYLKRTSQKAIKDLLKNFPCVAIIGSRQVGKSTLLKKLRPSAPFFDLELRRDYQRIASDPDFFLSQYEGRPIVIDEAQELPQLFPALRVAIDQNRDKNGQFLISGSSSPELLKNITESLAGRMAIFELYPFNVFESWELSISDLPSRLNSKKLELPQKARLTDQQIAKSFLLGGYPDAFCKGKKNSSFWKKWMTQYYSQYVHRDIRKLFPQLNFLVFQKFSEMLSYSSGEHINYSRFAQSLDVSVPTVKSYLQIAEGAFFWRRIKSFHHKVAQRIIKMPKGHLVDAGLVNFLSYITSKERLYSHPRVGQHWEAFVIEQLIRIFKDSLQPIDWSYYRTHNGAEVDFIIEGDFGLVPIEIKWGTSSEHRTLSQFVKKHKLPYGLVINNASEACWLNPSIAQIPFKNL